VALRENLTRLASRFRYPVSLPEDLAKDLGVQISNTLNYHDFLSLLASTYCRPTRLYKLMPREEAEVVFGSALKKERFKSSTLVSYYFNKGWLVLALYFDEGERLRRLNLQCPTSSSFEGFDLVLDDEPYLAPASSH